MSMSGFPETVSGLWWPNDRSWFVAMDVDLEWTFVAGGRDLVDRILEHPGLEAVATAPGNPVRVPEGPE